MYWNNPLINVVWPSKDIDPVEQSFHQGAHCLFWDPAFDFRKCSTNQKLNDLCSWARENISSQGIDAFVEDQRNWYDIANLVKLNLWIHDIRAQGIVKPWLILDQGDNTYLAGTGDSRMRCLERMPEITSVNAFVTCSQSRAHLYQHLEPVTNFDQFAALCGAVPGQTFLFRLTDSYAPYGIYWYEYDSSRTRSITPGESAAVDAFYRYYKNNPVEIKPEWFDQKITWNIQG